MQKAQSFRFTHHRGLLPPIGRSYAAAPGEVDYHPRQHEHLVDPALGRPAAKFFGKYGVKSKAVWVRGNPAQIAT